MDLYFSPISAYSHKVLMAFYEKDLPFNQIAVNLADASVRQEFRQVYALGKVPCLKVGGTIVSESSNIVEWLDQHYQVNKLIPGKVDDARQVRWLDRMADQYLTANAILLFFQSLKPTHLQDPERQDTARRQMAYMYDELERRLNEQSGPWLVGSQLSMADMSVAAGLGPSTGFAGLEAHPALNEYLKSWQQRESYIQARSGFESAVAQMVEVMEAG